MVIEDGEIIRCELSAGSSEPGMRGSLTARGGGPLAAATTPAGLSAASHAAQISDLLDAIDQGRAPSVTGEDGRAALEVVRAVYESARDGRTVQVPTVSGVRDNRSGSS